MRGHLLYYNCPVTLYRDGSILRLFCHGTVTLLQPAYPRNCYRTCGRPVERGGCGDWGCGGGESWNALAFNLDVSFVAHVKFCPWSMTFQCMCTYDEAMSQECYERVFISHFDPADLARIQIACHYDSAAVHCVDLKKKKKSRPLYRWYHNFHLQTLPFFSLKWLLFASSSS